MWRANNIGTPQILTKKNRAKPEKKKWGAEKIKKCNEKISVLVCRSPETKCGINSAEASGNAPHYFGFSLKKVRISTKRYRQFLISLNVKFGGVF